MAGGKLVVQPRARKRPIPADGGGRRVQRLGRLIEAQPAEEPALDDLRLPRVEAFEAIECLAQRNEVVERPLRGGIGVFDREDGRPGSTFRRTLAHRVIDEDVAHGARRDGKKMRAIAPVHAFDRQQLEEGFVNKFSRRQGVAGALAPKPVPGDPAQRVIDLRQQFPERSGIACGVCVQ